LGLMLVLTLGLSGGQQAAAQTNPLVRFDEQTGSLDPIFTHQIDPATGTWPVAKFIFNGSPFAWTDFHVKLQTFGPGGWVDSPESDGISFGQPTPFADWLKNVRVDINGVDVPGWHVNRTNQPFDILDFYFDTFMIQPGQTLSLHFEMSDFGSNTWRLVQVPTIPEPQESSLLILGLAGLALILRRNRH
jgi:hypothetical protein